MSGLYRYSVIPVDVNLYTTTGDFVRLVFELIYVACVLLGTYSELNEIFEVRKGSMMPPVLFELRLIFNTKRMLTKDGGSGSGVGEN